MEIGIKCSLGLDDMKCQGFFLKNGKIDQFDFYTAKSMSCNRLLKT